MDGEFRLLNQANLNTTNWQTYRNEQYGFEVKYPPDWTVNDQSFTGAGVQSANVRISSPIIHRFQKYEPDGIYAAVQISFTDGKKIVTDNGFYRPHKPGEQAVVSIEGDALSELLETIEHQVALKIIDLANKLP